MEFIKRRYSVLRQSMSNESHLFVLHDPVDEMRLPADGIRRLRLVDMIPVGLAHFTLFNSVRL